MDVNDLWHATCIYQQHCMSPIAIKFCNKLLYWNAVGMSIQCTTEDRYNLESNLKTGVHVYHYVTCHLCIV